MKRIVSRTLLVWSLPVAILLVDQLSKTIVLQNYPQWVVFNTQGTWGVLPSWIALIGLVALTILYYIKLISLPIFLILVTAGVSNALDRLWHPGVVDFIHILTFPVFNLADTTISLTVGWLLLTELVSKPGRHHD